MNLNNQLKNSWTEILQLNIYAIVRLVGRAEMQKGLILHPGVVVENWEGYLSCKGPSWEVRGLNPTLNAPAWNTSARKKSLYNIWLWKPGGDAICQGEMGDC